MVGSEATGKIWLSLANGRIVEMLFVGPLSDIGDLGIVNLDLVDLINCERLLGYCCVGADGKKRSDTET